MSEVSPKTLILMSRSPRDAVVGATLVEQLKTVGYDFTQATVLHASAYEYRGDTPFPIVHGAGHGVLPRRLLRMLRLTLLMLKQGQFAQVYVRDVLAALVARCAMRLTGVRVPLIFDCRGDIESEARLSGNTGWRVATLGVVQRSCLRRADRCLTVSAGMAEVIRAASPNTPVVVVPNLPQNVLPGDTDPPGRPLVVFAGGAQAWQAAEDVLQGLRQLAKFGIDVEIVTHDRDLRHAAADAGLPVSSGDRNYVLSRLQVATASWMVRREHRAASVASPIKMGEALASGAVIIGSSSTSELIDRLQAQGLAIVVNSQHSSLQRCAEVVESVWAGGKSERQRRLEQVEQSWTLPVYGEQLRWFYGVSKQAST